MEAEIKSYLENNFNDYVFMQEPACWKLMISISRADIPLETVRYAAATLLLSNRAALLCKLQRTYSEVYDDLVEYSSNEGMADFLTLYSKASTYLGIMLRKFASFSFAIEQNNYVVKIEVSAATSCEHVQQKYCSQVVTEADDARWDLIKQLPDCRYSSTWPIVQRKRDITFSSGTRVKHFKRSLMSECAQRDSLKYLYEVIGESLHTETGEILVNYQSLEDGKMYSRPKQIFYALVDLQKYPQTAQIYRFEECSAVDTALIENCLQPDSKIERLYKKEAKSHD